MISPYTPPGTPVEVINETGVCTNGKLARNYIAVGARFTVAGWQDADFCILQELAYDNGHPIGVHRARLRRLDLPSVLTDALTSQPLIHGRELETAL